MRLASFGAGTRVLAPPVPLRLLHHKHVRRRPVSTVGVEPAANKPCASTSADGSVPSPSASAESNTTQAPPSTGQQNAPSSIPTPTPPPPSTASSDGLHDGSTPFTIKPIYVFLFCLIFTGGTLFASATLQFTANMQFSSALVTVLRRVAKSVAFRQLIVICVAIFLVRFGLNNVLALLSKFSSSPVQWDKTKMYYVLREVYQPLELLLFIAGLCTIADSFVPQLIGVPKGTVAHVVRVILSISFIVGASTVVYNLKTRFTRENAWQCEMKGDVTSQRRWEAYDKLGTFAIYAVSLILGIQALGLEVSSVLAIGGIGGLAIGLAGREICENILNGFLIMTTNPFEVGDEVTFAPSGRVLEGIVMDIGWYRTLIRSFEREVYVIPNAVFSKNVVLNITRKGKEWRFYEFLNVRLQDVQKTNAIIQDIRRIVRNDARIITKLHRRVFLDKISDAECKIYLSFYVEASNRDAFMAVKQDLLLAFVDCVERNGAKLALPRTVIEMDSDTEGIRLSGIGPMAGMPMNMNVAGAMAISDASSASMSSNGSNGSNGGGGGGSSAGNGNGALQTVDIPVDSLAQAPSSPASSSRSGTPSDGSGKLQAEPVLAYGAAGMPAMAGAGAGASAAAANNVVPISGQQQGAAGSSKNSGAAAPRRPLATAAATAAVALGPTGLVPLAGDAAAAAVAAPAAAAPAAAAAAAPAARPPQPAAPAGLAALAPAAAVAAAAAAAAVVQQGGEVVMASFEDA